MTLLCIRNLRVVRITVLACIVTLVFAAIADTAFAQNERPDTMLSTTEIARRATPTVVTIVTPSGHGSGVIVEPTGVVVTNLHVISGENLAEVILHNGDIYDDVTVVDIDERRDLVVLKIKAYNISSAMFGDSDEVDVGEDVVLIGSPHGLATTLSEGIISAIRDTGNGYHLLQTSAPASPGSSGGGMFNVYGELIGIVTSQVREGQNLNFAVPINYVRGLISTEATMTLTELAERMRSISDEKSDHQTPVSIDDKTGSEESAETLKYMGWVFVAGGAISSLAAFDYYHGCPNRGEYCLIEDLQAEFKRPMMLYGGLAAISGGFIMIHKGVTMGQNQKLELMLAPMRAQLTFTF